MSRKSKKAAKASMGAAKAAKAANDYVVCYGPLEKTTQKRERATKKTNRLEKRKAKAERELVVCDGMNIGYGTRQSEINSRISTLNTNKSKLNNQLSQAQANGDTARAQAIQSRISRIDNKISKNTTFTQAIETKKQTLSAKSASLSAVAASLSVLKVQEGTKAADLFNRENELTKKLLKTEDRFDRNQNIADQATLAVDSSDCRCPAIYDPVVIDGVTYGNACIAACRGKTIPSNPTPPTSKAPIAGVPRKCLNATICGSDGVTYPNNCLPFGVFAIWYGKPCNDVGFAPSNPGIPTHKPPAKITNGRILNLVGSGNAIPQKICGSNNQTYNSVNDLPNGVSIKHFGSCGGIV